jgi:CHAP domain
MNWLANAPAHGYTVLSKPAPDTVVVYGAGNGYSSLGHVAVVDSVNSDGSFQVSEMNYSGFDMIDQRRSTMKGVIGFIVPPGSSYKPTTAVAAAAFTAATSSANNCVTGGPNIFGAQICMDGAVGILAIAGGGLLLIAGVVVFAAFALAKTGAVEKVAGSVGPLAGPWGAVASLAVRTSKPKAKPVAPSAAEGKAASDARVATAKARLSPGTQAQVDLAASGRGRKLTPEAREEINSQRSAA